MITWLTPKGNLGTFRELDYQDIILSATDSNNRPLEFKLQSGTVPPGMYVTANGHFKGVPAINASTSSDSVTYTFTVRASNNDGNIADRTFYVVIDAYIPVQIVNRPPSGILRLGTFDDASPVNYQFNAVSSKANANIKWQITSGEVPVDIRTNEPIALTTDGLFSGYFARLLDTSAETAGYAVESADAFPYDFSALSRNVVYRFTVQATDGISSDSMLVEITVVSKGHFTADNAITTVDSDFLTIDADNRYVPIIITDPSSIPQLQAGNRFAFKFEAIDPENDTINWQSNAGVPNGLTLSSITGWLTGTIPSQVPESITYAFTVQAYKRDKPTYISRPLEVRITSLKNASNYVTWVTPTNVGTLINGQISELDIKAISNLGKPVTYQLIDGSLPAGLELLTNGNIIGRTTFKYFSLDGFKSKLTVANAFGITTGMTVQGPGVAAGSTVLEIIDEDTITISPSINVSEGTELTFANLITSTEYYTRTTSLSTSTSIDNDTTTFDCTFNFTAQATTTDLTASSVKDFSITIDNYNRAPFENVYLKALPRYEQRQLFDSILSNTSIFPPALLYRPEDPYFGLSEDIRMLFLAGLSSSELSKFANSVQYNHYNKTINFGAVKTARAVDQNFNTKYEVVYLEIPDDKTSDGVSAALSQEPAITNYYEGVYHTIYPNSFENMAYRLSTGIGFVNRGALPDWMVSPQEDGTTPGLKRVVVLAYTVPGASKLIAYRLKNNNITFSDIQFVADRYVVDTTLIKNYNFNNNAFGNTDYNVSYITHPVEVVSGNQLKPGTWVALMNPGKTADDDLIVTEAIPGPQEATPTDNYSDPYSDDKYIKFPQIGVYK